MVQRQKGTKSHRGQGRGVNKLERKLEKVLYLEHKSRTVFRAQVTEGAAV